MLDKASSGFAYAMNRMPGHPLIASIKFQMSVRSELAQISVDLLSYR